MIEVTIPGKNERHVLLNPHLIEYVEQVGQGRTSLLLTNGKSFVVTESPQEIRLRIIDYRREVTCGE